MIGVYNQEGIFVGDILEQLTDNLQGKDLQSYLCKKHKWERSDLDHITGQQSKVQLIHTNRTSKPKYAN